MTSLAKALLQKEYKRIRTTDSNFFIDLVDDSLFKWLVSFPGPEGSLYEGGYFSSELEFPLDFPNQPPTMKINQDVFHPNVYPSGSVCISILHSPGVDEFNEQESADLRWRPILGVESILISVISMLSDPNLDSPANVDAAKMMKEDLEGYKRRVRRLAEKTLEM
eukprot:GHVH01004466.1.p1 GENE.GHVH01004466.1~~GHVH01004466.1.p1  ORF type:complete len:165 (+),score=26.39 GHVH01004466.1:198-692(+)